MHHMPSSPLVILAEPIEAAPRAWLEGQVDLRELGIGDPGFNQVLAEAEGIVVRTATEVNQVMIDKAPNLRVVARAGVGLDTIDLDACAARGITVLNVPDANTQAVVEFVIASVTDALRPREQLHQAVDESMWRRMRSSETASVQMDTLRFGVLGFGRIGSRVAEVASAIGFAVLYTDLLEVPESRRHGATSVSLDDLLGNSDVLSVHVDGRTSNRNLLGARELSLMSDTSLLVNTSRGFVIDESALADRLQRHSAARAILDVHEREPIPLDSSLVGLPNAVLHPHIAARTTTGLLNMGWVVRDLVEHLGVVIAAEDG